MPHDSCDNFQRNAIKDERDYFNISSLKGTFHGNTGRDLTLPSTITGVLKNVFISENNDFRVIIYALYHTGYRNRISKLTLQSHLVSVFRPFKTLPAEQLFVQTDPSRLPLEQVQTAEFGTSPA